MKYSSRHRRYFISNYPPLLSFLDGQFGEQGWLDESNVPPAQKPGELDSNTVGSPSQFEEDTQQVKLYHLG